MSGDAGWSGVKPFVESIGKSDVNDFGSWVVEADGGSDNGNDHGVLHNGNLIFQEATQLNLPASHTISGTNNWRYGVDTDTLEINNNGDILLEAKSCRDLDGIQADRDITFWVSGATGTIYALLEEGLTSSESMIVPAGAGLDQPVGAVWTTIDEVWQNNNNQLLVYGNTSLAPTGDVLVFMEHDGAGTITLQKMIMSAGVNHTVFDNGNPGNMFSVEHNQIVFTGNPARRVQAINDNGQAIFFIQESGSAPSNFDENTYYYLYDNALDIQKELIWEADLSPNPNSVGFPWEELNNFEVDINNNEVSVYSGADDGPFATDRLILTIDDLGTETVFITEGALVPGDLGTIDGFILGSGFGTTTINDNGDIVWFNSWNDPDTDVNSGIFKNMTLIVQEGDLVDGSPITSVNDSTEGMINSDSALYMINRMSIGSNGGIFLIDCTESTFLSSCNGDGGDQAGCTNCRACSGNAPMGTVGGCLNTSGTSARLVPSGVASIANDNLRFEVSGATPSQLCVLGSGDNLAPNNGANPCFGMNSGVPSMVLDGLRCVVGNNLRHGNRMADLSGDVGVTSPGWGGGDMPLSGIAAQAGFAMGQTRHFQVTYRDDSLLGCMTGLSTTQAVSVTWEL